MTFPRNEDFILEYEYDFSVDGGAVSSISLSPKVNAIANGIIIRDIEIVVKTALASGGAATVTLGNTGDTDGYLADFFALANAAENVIRVGEVAGALLWDDTNDHRLSYAVDSTANNQDLILAVGTAALTAGKLEIKIYCGYNPDA